MAWLMTSSFRVIFDNFGYVQILKMSKVRLYNEARASNEGEEASKSIITAFNPKQAGHFADWYDYSVPPSVISV